MGIQIETPPGFQLHSPLVVHCKRSPFDAYIGRPSPWCNPFSHLPKSAAKFQCSSREEAVDKYAGWLISQPGLVAKVKRELRGRVLGCWCAPKLCHGHVLTFVANNHDAYYEWWAAGVRAYVEAKAPIPPAK